jgi:hypothetical protein
MIQDIVTGQQPIVMYDNIQMGVAMGKTDANGECTITGGVTVG